jgi:hypothetical protein
MGLARHTLGPAALSLRIALQNLAMLSSVPRPPRVLGTSAAPPPPPPIGVGAASALVAVLLALQLGLYLWMAPRGFDFSDESFYLLHYQHWRTLSATTSFFGTFFAPAFAASGESLALMRVLSALLLVGSCGWLAHALLLHAAPGFTRGQRLTWVMAGAASGMLYFGFLSTLRAPSYNLMALCAALWATAVLLHLAPRTAVDEAPALRRRAWMVLYGVCLGLCALGKVTSAALLVPSHLLLLAAMGRAGLVRLVFPLLGWGSIGLALPLSLLQLLHPGWLQAVQESVALTAATDGRGVGMLARGLRWELQRLPALLWLCVVVLGLSLAWQRRRGIVLSRTLVTVLALLAALLLLPLALSFGTNLPLLQHSQINGAFALLALLVLLARLHESGRLAPAAAGLCLAALCLPGLVFQLRAALDVAHTYRQRTALGEQHVPVQLGRQGTRLLVDAGTAQTLKRVTEAAAQAGWHHGQPLLDFTGDGPGLIFALGAQPIGVPWLLGGYAGSEAAAQRLLSSQPEGLLRRAWMISSSTNPRRIAAGPSLLAARLGLDSHQQVAVVQVSAPYQWGQKPVSTLDVQIWRPISAAATPGQ